MISEINNYRNNPPPLSGRKEIPSNSSKKTRSTLPNSKTSSGLSSGFFVTEITGNPKSLAKAKEICKIWKNTTPQYFNSELTPEQEQRLSDSLVINETLAGHSMENCAVFICKSSNSEEVQAIALSTETESSLELELLSTNPVNIVGREGAVKGAGTQLVKHLFQKCITENKDSLNLYARSSSFGFYEKIGLSVVGEKPNSETCFENVPMSIGREEILRQIRST